MVSFCRPPYPPIPSTFPPLRLFTLFPLFTPTAVSPHLTYTFPCSLAPPLYPPSMPILGVATKRSYCTPFSFSLNLSPQITDFFYIPTKRSLKEK